MRIGLVVLLNFLVFVMFSAAAYAGNFSLSEGRTHISFNIASYHLNASRDFNEVNPGIGIGRSFRLGETNAEIDAEIGIYKNSLERQTIYAMTSLDTRVARLGSAATLRMGVFSGLAHYPGDTNKFKKQGVPTIGNWVMAVGGQAALRINDRHDLRVRVMPAGKVADALFTLQIVTRF